MKLLREPLAHFLVAGALLFGGYGWLNRREPGARSADRTVRIGEREMAWITETWKRQWQRPPSAGELQVLVAGYLREELLAREARELELDRDDTVVRRRLAQKMEFLLADTARLAEPPEAELRSLYEAKAASLAAPPTTSFVQVFFDAEARGERAEEDARTALGRLARTGGAARLAEVGDPSLLPAEVTEADERTIAGQFGAEFARAVAVLLPGTWQGPIESTFGVHLVRVTARVAARRRAFDEVREELVAEWRRERETAARDGYFAELLRKYDVQVAESVQSLVGPALVTTGSERR